jgi:hypothetical protein
MLPRVFSRGSIRGGRDPLAGGTRTGMQHYPAHVTWTRRRAPRVTAASGMTGGAERRSSDELLEYFGERLLWARNIAVGYKIALCIKFDIAIIWGRVEVKLADRKVGFNCLFESSMIF